MSERSRLGFTGTQKGMTSSQKLTVCQILGKLLPIEVHHGDCIGADADFHDIALGRLCIFTVIHPPKVTSKRAWKGGNKDLISYEPEQDYLTRNKNIVRFSDILLATPGEMTEVLRSGTWSTIRYARKAKRPILIVFPNGLVKTENSALTVEGWRLWHL